jgi:ABC-2 type transport system ATP-binding protein
VGEGQTQAAPLAVELTDVSKRYGRTVALDRVSFDIRRGEFFALLGPNGAGKTTLLHILCSILRPDGGVALINGVDVAREPLKARQTLGVVFQEPSLDDRLTVRENLDFHGLVYGVPRALRRERIDYMLDVVELGARKEAPVRSLSSGMKRRLEIARALIHDSTILLLDEPTVGLDAQSREAIWGHVERLRSERGLTVIVTTHYVEEVETADRVCIIDQGRVVALDAPGALKAQHGKETIRFVPRDEAAAADLLARYPELAARRGAVIEVAIPGPDFNDRFLAEFGNRAKELSFERPSLEGVFLAVTGKELRDQAAGPRERTLAFGRQGGEHTR